MRLLGLSAARKKHFRRAPESFPSGGGRSSFARKKERTRKIQLDPNYNAVQIKFAYAVTCHKAQGGQWRNVYVDQGWLPPDGINRSYYRWLYTAFTRATHRVNLVNWPDEQTS